MSDQSPTYQHFVPQFLLKNFAHPYSNPTVDSKQSKRRGKPKREKGMPFMGEPVVHHVNLNLDPPQITETPVKRIMGQMDMYRDTSQPGYKQQHIEEMFSKMESRASTIFRRITKAFDAGDPAIWLTRDERNLLRKFLFLLKYRGSTFHRRFYHVDIEDYSADDSPILRDYMEEQGFKRPVDVWFHNLKAIMELDMDAKGDWAQKIFARMYPDDASWFFAHVQFFYIAICTPPQESAHEFFLTDNCYNIFEGPVSVSRDRNSGKLVNGVYNTLHEFAPISPRLIIVLRSCVFPVPDEDADPKMKKQRERLRDEVLGHYFGPDAITASVLFSLPVRKAQNSYSEFVNGRLRLRQGEDGKHKRSDKFRFEFFHISEDLVDNINEILLDNSWLANNVIFASRPNFFKALERYLTTPSSAGKRTTGADGDTLLITLEKFAALLKSMGSDKQPVWTEISVDSVIDYDKWMEFHIATHKLTLEWARTKLIDHNPFTRIYMKLNGWPFTIPEDFEQAELMWKLRVKIDSWSNGVDELIRQRNRDLLTAAYLRCSPRRVWIYMKVMKYCIFFHPKETRGKVNRNELMDQAMSGGEDAIANARSLFGEDDESLNRLMYNTVMNEIEIKTSKILNLWAPVTANRIYFPLLSIMRKTVLVIPGKICFCGIPIIEQMAWCIEAKLRQSRSTGLGNTNIMGLDDEVVIEILTRVKIRSRFVESLGNRLEETALQNLKRTFFEVTYPTPPLTDPQWNI